MKARKSWAMAYCGMAAALSVALMLLGAVIPIAMFIAPALAGFLIATVCVECGRTMALTAYAAVSLLALLFVPDKEVALIFVFLLGYYPLAKPCFEKIRPALLRAVCKLLLCNGAVLAMYGLVLLLVPAGKYGNVYGLFRSMGYNGTLLDEGVFFVLTGGLILLALLQMKKHGPQKNVDWYAALILGFAAAFSLPIAGLSYMGVLFCLGVTMGVARKISYRFAAVSSVLTLLVLGVVEICTCVTYVNIIAGIVAVVLSAAVTYFMVKLMLWILHGGKLKAFAYYDFALAGVCVVVGIFELILR